MSYSRVASIITLTVGLASSAPSLATVTFTPVMPGPCNGTQTLVNFKYNLSWSGTGEWQVPDNPNIPGSYIFNVHYKVGVMANALVYGFDLRVDNFDTELNYDYLKLNSFSDVRTLTGNGPTAPTGWQSFPTELYPIQQANSNMVFHSDDTVTGAGIVIGQARVCNIFPNNPPSTTPRPTEPVTRYMGVLLGANDVIYLSAPVGSVKTGDTCSTAHDTFALWGDPAAGNDFDLYVLSHPLISGRRSSERSRAA